MVKELDDKNKVFSSEFHLKFRKLEHFALANYVVKVSNWQYYT